MRLSPQDIDRRVNEELDDVEWYSSLGLNPPGHARGGQPQEDKLPAAKRGGTSRTVVHQRHGRMPTLDDIERR